VSETSGSVRPEQQRALAALLAGETVQRAAAAAGVSDRTVRRWREQPAFVEALEAAQRELHAEVTARLRALTKQALDAVRRGLTTGTPWQRARVGLRLLEGLGHLGRYTDVILETRGRLEEPPSVPLRELLDGEELEAFLSSSRVVGDIARRARGEPRHHPLIEPPLAPAPEESEEPAPEEPDPLGRALAAYRVAARG
jgi:hypothetical protein